MLCNSRSPNKGLFQAGFAALVLLALPVSQPNAQTAANSAAPVSVQAPAQIPTPAPPSSKTAATSQQAHPQLPGSRLQGQALLRVLGFRIYEAQVWTLPNFRPADWSSQTLVLQLDYQRAFKGSAIAERSLQEMRRGGPIPDAQAAAWLSAMQRVFPDVKAGEQIVGLYLPGQGARFWHQGKALGQIDDAAFARLFFGIWLAEHSSEPAMRLVLLGQSKAGAGATP
jgi:Chalcone isomerase-like